MILDGKETERDRDRVMQKIWEISKVYWMSKDHQSHTSNIRLPPTYFCLVQSKSEMIKKKQKNEMKLMEKGTSRHQVV